MSQMVENSSASTDSENTVHFAHANGFPAGSYKKLWRSLPDSLHVIAHDKFGHNQSLPVNDNWQNQITELIHYLEANARQPVYAVGHSFGGVVSFMTCCQRPDLFKGLIMLDPPIMAGPIAPLFRFIKKTSLIDKVSPSGKSRLRKTFWESHENPVDYFKPKALFRNFDEECLYDYVKSATKKEKSGTRLTFDAAIETAIFRKLPHNINSFKNKLTRPAKLFTAQHTNVCFPPLIRRFLKQHRGLDHEMIKGVGHMFPFEKPQMTAKLIANTIKQWEAEA